MKKRIFLQAAGAGAVAMMGAPARPQQEKPRKAGPALLTITGDIGRANRGALDPALDQLMVKHKVFFDRAYTLDHEALAALPQATIRPVLEYDGKPHRLSGPLLTDVIRSAGGEAGGSASILLRAIDGYAVTVGAADFAKYRFMAATHLDGKPMPLGGLGPVWAVYDADRFPDLAAKPLKQRFGLCPWALYHVALVRA